jgi:hypothetical protein
MDGCEWIDWYQEIYTNVYVAFPGGRSRVGEASCDVEQG